MSLRGKKPEQIRKRLKALFYGTAGVGKTTAAIQFPKPYLIDTERGAENDQYVNLLKQNEGAIFQTSSFADILKEVESLLTIKHPYKTLVIDPMTTIYNDLLDIAEKKLGSDYGRHYGEANRNIKILLKLLLRLDMNVIITSHSKNEYAENMKVIGQSYDCYRKLDYLFDLVFEIQKRGKERIGIVKKSRIESFPDGEQFPFSYQEISRKYGNEVLEKDSIPIKIASAEQVNELNRLVNLLKVDESIVKKWLDKGDADCFDLLNYDYADKIITALTSKIKGETTDV